MRVMNSLGVGVGVVVLGRGRHLYRGSESGVDLGPRRLDRGGGLEGAIFSVASIASTNSPRSP